MLNWCTEDHGLIYDKLGIGFVCDKTTVQYLNYKWLSVLANGLSSACLVQTKSEYFSVIPKYCLVLSSNLYEP